MGSSDPTYSLSVPSSVEEGATCTTTVTTANVDDGTTLYWDAVSVNNVTSADFVSGAMDGSITITSNAATFAVYTEADSATEGPETFKTRLFTDAARTNQVAESSTITINDTSTGPIPDGSQTYTTAGTYNWTCPSNVISVCAVCIGGGGGVNDTNWSGGGAGGGLGYTNNISVTPGQSYTVVVGAAGVNGVSGVGVDGGDSYFISSSTVKGGGGMTQIGEFSGTNADGGTYTGDGGGVGGKGGYYSSGSTGYYGGGGGAGGYSGSGGDGGTNVASWATQVSSGSGGGGGGGWAIQGVVQSDAGAGGGTGIQGSGSNGAAGNGNSTSDYGGRGGSGGSNGTWGNTSNGEASTAGSYGGGASGKGDAAGGAVRLIWGSGRSFPSTNTSDPQGQSEYTTQGTYSWTCPAGVTSVSVVAVGAGGTNAGNGGAGGFDGSAGGGLGWKNNISVTPGQSYTVVVGESNNTNSAPFDISTGREYYDGPGDSYFISKTTVKGGSGWLNCNGYGSCNPIGGDFVGDGGGDGGQGGIKWTYDSYGAGAGGGGGAGGYVGAGGTGGKGGSSYQLQSAPSGYGPQGGLGNPGQGGGGGGAGGAGSGSAGGGGVGLLGQGADGTGGTKYTYNSSNPTPMGGGGSGGADGGGTGASDPNGGNGGNYGGGGGSYGNGGPVGQSANGAVRIIWGPNRSFPSTNTADV